MVPEEKEKQVNLKTNEVSEPIKNQETSQFQINQQEDINENTENVDFINKYNDTLAKHIEPNQTEGDFLKSLNISIKLNLIYIESLSIVWQY